MKVASTPPPDSTRRAGFSLVDVAVALAILAISLGTLLGSVFWAMRLEEANEESATASQHLRSVLEQLRARPMSEVYAAFNADPDDDPRPGVDELGALVSADPILHVGKKHAPVLAIRFPEDEDRLDPGQTTLPVLVRLEWEGTSGPRSVELSACLRSR
jgi:hypothetical protein